MSKKTDLTKKLYKELGLMDRVDVHAIRQAAILQEFESNVGARVLILMAPYPFLIIGTIMDISYDVILIKTEVTNVSELDNELFRIHLDQVDVFFIENERHKIPELKEDNC
ncbi:hypothetical protein [Peribacillus glennii]|uniref:Uncharacterized protein n=1 Tax=Peribacillus glennii TaxID=2303991 RepID=A0A372L801_9BACI|nr:hypothetical protein [Peribacillus glennii]RFU61434.1 hypothetical protein D0466_18300 [Peribacillus glennii]